MYPRLYFTDSISVSMYALIYMIAIVTGIVVGYLGNKSYKIPVQDFPAMAFWTILSGMIGAKLFHIFFSSWQSFLQHPIHTLFRSGGWMYYGLEVCGLIGILVFLTIKRLPVWRQLDVIGLVLLISHSVGRWGCFFHGCCYGTPTEVPWAVQFPQLPGPVHPTQIYESVVLFIGFVFVIVFRKKFKIPGTIFVFYLFYYSIFRFFNEFFRGDVNRFGFFHYSPSQYVAMVLIFSAGCILIFLLWSYRKASINLNGNQVKEYQKEVGHI